MRLTGRKYGILAVAGVAAVVAAGMACAHTRGEQQTVLRYGTFIGSNWDVESKNSYMIIDDAIIRFEHDHPGVTVEYESGIAKEDYSEWLSQRLLLDDAPDVFVVPDTDLDLLVSRGILEELDPLIGGADGIDTSIYYDTALESGRLRGAQYALPMETMPYLMFCNKALLESENIELPSEDYTFEDLYEICSKVTRDVDGDGTVDQFGIYKYDWEDAAIGAGAVLFSRDGGSCDFTSEEFKEAIQFMIRLNDLNQGQTVTQEIFDQGRVAFMPLSLAEYRTYKTYPYRIKKYDNIQWDCIVMPRGTNGDNVSRVSTMNIGINHNSRNKELAWEFLRYITTDINIQTENVHYTSAASPLRSVMTSERVASYIANGEDQNEIRASLLDKVIEEGAVNPNFESYAGAVELADNEILQIYSEADQSDLDGALRDLQRREREYLAAN